MERYRLHRKVASVLLVGVMLLPLACNMSAPISGNEVTEGESAWEWLEIFQAYRNREPAPTSTPTPDPFMQAVNEALAGQMQAGPLAPMIEDQSGTYHAPDSDFSCLEEDGSMVAYLNEYPSEPSLETNSIQHKEFLFALFQDDLGGFDLTWRLSYQVLHRVVDSREDPSHPKIYHERTYDAAEGEGGLQALGMGQFAGDLPMKQASRGEAGNKYNLGASSEAEYSVAGLYGPEGKTMHLCISGVNPLLQARSQELAAGGVPRFRAWCQEANLSYFVCTEATLFRPSVP